MDGEKEKEPAREKEKWKEKDKQKAQTRRKERRGKGRGQPKAKGRKRKTISFLCLCSRRFPCHAPGPFNYSICSFSYGLLAGCLHKGPRCHFWVSVGIGSSIGWKGVTFSSTRSTKFKARFGAIPCPMSIYTKKCDLMQAPSGSCFLKATEGNPAFQHLCK